MHRGEHFQRVIKVFILAFLCNEMHSSFTHSSAFEDRLISYPSSINGTETPFERAKHQASIRLVDEDHHFGEGHICGGAVIAPSVVLTVAHCLHNYQKNAARHPAELKVVMGSRNRYQRDEHTLVYGVTHVHRPSTFNAQTLRDNIAIILLERDIPNGHPSVKPITLSNFAKHNTRNFEVTSWCVTEKHVPYTQLMTLNVSHLTAEQCREHYGRFYGPGMLCFSHTHFEAAPACPGDAGAPLLQNNRLLALSGGVAVKGQAVIIYTNVANHAKWIAEHVGDGHNQNSSLWGTLALSLFTLWILTRKYADLKKRM